MDKEALKQKVLSFTPDAIFELSADGLLHVIVDSSKVHELLSRLKADADTGINYLYCLTAADWKQFYYVIYFLRSFSVVHYEGRSSFHNKIELVVKGKINDRENPQTDSICDLWQGAELLEREVYDFFGIKFNRHPFLKRIFLDEDWKGYPLRKDYSDEVNIVEL